MNIYGGILLIGLGAFTSGSFAVPFKKIREWRWETYWMVYSLAAYIIFPFLACMIFVPRYAEIITSNHSSVLLKVFTLGAIYGIGNLSFGLALRYLGLSLGYALSLGLMLGIGTLIPPAIDGRLLIMFETSGAHILFAGIFVASIGITLSAWAGILKDKRISDTVKKQSVGEYNLVKGLLSAFLVGITGSAMALGFEQGLPLSDIAIEKGVDPLYSIIPVLLVLLSGTFVTTFIWCILIQGRRNKSLVDYRYASAGKVLGMNYLYGSLAGLLWFSQFILYGMGKSKMGPFTFTSWGILMALTIASASIWGIIRKEWKGAPPKVYFIMLLSLLIIVIASFMIGMSGTQ